MHYKSESKPTTDVSFKQTQKLELPLLSVKHISHQEFACLIFQEAGQADKSIQATICGPSRGIIKINFRRHYSSNDECVPMLCCLKDVLE